MDFNLSQNQRHYQELACGLVREKIASRAAKVDATGDYPWDNVRMMADAGLYRLPIPKVYDGLDENYLTLCLVQEELAKGCASTALTLAATWTASLCIKFAGSEEQKRKYLPPIARGQKSATMGITEHGGGSDVSAIKTEAVLVDDCYRLNGLKFFAGGAGPAETYIIAAKTNIEKGSRGISLFIVEKNTPGFKIGKIERKMGFRGQPHGELILNNCKVPKSNLLGEIDRGFKTVMQAFNISRGWGAAESIGIAQAAFDEALAFSKSRVTFGQPICQHQAIQFMLVDMAVEINAARLLMYQAAEVADQGASRIAKECAIAKLFASQMVSKVTHKALQIHGGVGYTEDYPVERHYREARAWELMDGTSEIQRIVIGRELLRE